MEDVRVRNKQRGTHMSEETRTVWNWDNPVCIHALYSAMKNATYYSDVGRELNKQFVPENGNPKGLTRNVFIGAFRRGSAQRRLVAVGYQKEEISNIASRFAQGERRTIPRRTVHSKGRARQQATLKKRSIKVKPSETPQLPANGEAPVELEPVRLADGAMVTTLTLTDSMCKFPIGEPGTKDFAFCGRAISRGSYCTDHAKSTYQTPAKRRRTKKDGDRLRDALRDRRLN